MNIMENLKFHHIGIACYDIQASKVFYENMGYEAAECIIDPIQDIEICFLHKSGQPLIELLAPVDEKSPVNRIISVNGVSPYHICYSVPDIIQAIKRLRSEKFVQIGREAKACAMNDALVCFFFRKDVGLIELVELS